MPSKPTALTIGLQRDVQGHAHACYGGCRANHGGSGDIAEWTSVALLLLLCFCAIRVPVVLYVCKRRYLKGDMSISATRTRSSQLSAQLAASFTVDTPLQPKPASHLPGWQKGSDMAEIKDHEFPLVQEVRVPFLDDLIRFPKTNPYAGIHATYTPTHRYGFETPPSNFKMVYFYLVKY